jgi:hypothetical protein
MENRPSPGGLRARHWGQWMKLSYGGPLVLSSFSDLTKGPIDAGRAERVRAELYRVTFARTKGSLWLGEGSAAGG